MGRRPPLRRQDQPTGARTAAPPGPARPASTGESPRSVSSCARADGEGPPPPRLDERTALLVSLLADRHNLTVTEDAARQDISDDLDHVARLMRIGRQATKMYVTDEVISDMADRIAVAVAEHQTTAVAEHQGVVDLDTERRRRR